MRRRNWIWVCLVSALLVASGCDDDTTDNTTGDATGQDTSTGGDATTDTSTTEDTATDTATGGDPINPEWATYDPAESTNLSYLHTLVVPDVVDGVPTCCKDYGDISLNDGIDNAFANLAGSLSGAGISLQDIIDEQITTGGLVLIYDHVEFDGIPDEDGFVLAGLLGEFEGTTTYAEASAGTGTFNVTASAFAENGAPLIFFDPATMGEGGAMTTPEDTFILSLPLGTVALTLPVLDTEVTGIATQESGGISYANGTLSGYIAVDSFFEALNTVAVTQCTCFGLTGDPFDKTDENNLFYFDGSAWQSNCPDGATLTACGADNTVCQTIGGTTLTEGQLCGLATSLIPTLADIDLDGDDTTYEAVTVGLEWEASAATVIGVTE